MIINDVGNDLNAIAVAMGFDRPVVELLQGDASSRRYFRVVDAQNQKVIICHSPDPRVHDNFKVVRKYFESSGVSVPKVYNIEHDEHFLVQEDFGNSLLLQRLASQYWLDHKKIEQVYRMAIESIVKIHDSGVTIPNSIKNLEFNEEKLLQEWEVTKEYFLYKYLCRSGTENSREEDMESEISALDNRMRKICEDLSRPKKVVVHRDYHSKNIMLMGSENAELGIIDFQDARMGIGQYDLVSLLEDCYFQIPKEIKLSLKNYYWEICDSIKETFPNKKDYLKKYNQMAIQRILKALGSFAMINFEKSNPLYLKYVGIGLEHLMSICQEDEFVDVKKALLGLYYGN